MLISAFNEPLSSIDDKFISGAVTHIATTLCESETLSRTRKHHKYTRDSWTIVGERSQVACIQWSRLASCMCTKTRFVITSKFQGQLLPVSADNDTHDYATSEYAQ